MINARTIYDTLSRRGFGITLIYRGADRVSVWAGLTRKDMRRATARNELQAAVLLWNRLGCLPVLRAVGERFAEVVPVSAPNWPRRLLLAGLRFVRGPAATSGDKPRSSAG